MTLIRGATPKYESRDLNLQQFSKNVDKLSFYFEESNFDEVIFSARRNDDEESMKITVPYNPTTKRYEYVIGQDEEDNDSTSSWFTWIMGKLTITVYLVSKDQYKPMQTFNFFVNPTILGSGESLKVPAPLIDQILNCLNKKVNINDGEANNITINGGLINRVNLIMCDATTPVNDFNVANKKYVDNKIKTYNYQPTEEEVGIDNYMIVIQK